MRADLYIDKLRSERNEARDRFNKASALLDVKEARIFTLEKAFREILDVLTSDYVRRDIYDAVIIAGDVAREALEGTYVRSEADVKDDENERRIDTLETVLRELLGALSEEDVRFADESRCEAALDAARKALP